MLEPQSRQLLLETLRPPEGYDLDFALATTYSLDLLALLVAPIGFTLAELQTKPDDELRGGDALLLLRTLRRYAERMAIFCQAGRIAVPRRHALLFGHLESSVVEVVAPRPQRAFHPKVWVLRFTTENEPTRYRVLCLTRNLTFDRSWDTSLTLDATVLDRARGFTANRPLADFVAALPGLAIRDDAVSPRVQQYVATAADELRRCAFDIPLPFTEAEFHPLGIDGYRRWPFLPARRALVVSPFIATGCLARLATGSDRDVLVARPEELDRCGGEVPESFADVLTMDPDLPAEQTSTEDESAEDVGAQATSGLHAKLYVLEEGSEAHLYTGSANATVAAFDGNVEFLVRLTGRRRDCGIDALLVSEPGRTGLRDILRSYEPPSEPPGEDVALREALERRLDVARRALSALEWVATVTDATTTGRFAVLLSAEGADALSELEPSLRVLARPVLLPDTSALRMQTDSAPALRFDGLSFESLTAFFAFDVALTNEPAAPPCQFVVNARLVGAPEGRAEAITQYLLRDRQQVLRFLLLLLADRDDEAFTTGGLNGGSAELVSPAGAEHAAGGPVALLEPLLRALDRDPARLDEVARILDDLRATEEGRAKLPVGIDDIWLPIWTAREQMRT